MNKIGYLFDCIHTAEYNREQKYKFEQLKLNAHYLSFEIAGKSYKFISKLPKNYLEFCSKKNFKLFDIDKLKIF